MSRAVIAVALVLCLPHGSAAQEPDTRDISGLPTPGELEGWFAPTTPARAAEFLASLSETSRIVSVDTLVSIPGDPVQPDSALPVHLVMVRRHPESGADTPAAQPVRVLVLAGQRGDDLAGLEVSLRTMRDLAVGPLRPLLDELDVAFVPAVNPWGMLWWVREEPSGVDPARDHVDLRSEASRAVHQLASVWKPDVVVELRELGPQVYRMQAGLPVHPNVDPQLRRYGRFYLLPYVANELAKAAILFREHVSVDPEPEELLPLIGGAADLPPGTYLTPGPLGAERARNSFALAGSLTLMLGVASVGGVEGLGSRVELQYRALKALLEVTAGRASGLREQTASARRLPAAQGVGPDPPALTLRARYDTDPEHSRLNWLVWSERGTMVNESTDRWRSAVRRELALPLPAGWVIEPDAAEWADLVRAHGFTVERLSRTARLETDAYPVGATRGVSPEVSANLPLEKAADASALLVRVKRELPAGSWVVRCDQPGARLLFTLIEPWSQDAPLSAESRSERGPDATDASFLYPVYRIDAEALSDLRTDDPAAGAVVPPRESR